MNGDNGVDKQIESDRMLAVYQAAQQHYYASTNYTWQVGGPLIAGVFVLWGLMFGETELICDIPKIRILCCVLISLISTIWLIFAFIQRVHATHSLLQLIDIENTMGIGFYGWIDDKKRLRCKKRFSYRIKGKLLEYLIWSSLFLGGWVGLLFIEKNKMGTEHFILIGIIFIIVSLFYDFFNRKLDDWKINSAC